MRYMLILLALLFANVAEAIDCKTPPDCAELGYSKENDPNCANDGYMYCVYDTSYKKCVQHNCEGLGFTTSDKTSWCKDIVHCTDNEQYTLCNENIPPLQCEIGDVYYADGSCGNVKDYSSDKIAVGVVYWVTEDKQHGKVINLRDLGRNFQGKFDPTDPYAYYGQFQWSDFGTDISNLKNWDCASFLSTAKTGNHSNEFWSGGKTYTEIMSTSKNDMFAAPAVLAFYPPEVKANDEKVGAGNWYLPTLGELMDLYGYDYSGINNCKEMIGAISDGANGNTLKMVNATLAALKNNNVAANELPTNEFYWSSSEFNKNYSWTLYTGDGARLSINKNNGYYVRASLEF